MAHPIKAEKFSITFLVLAIAILFSGCVSPQQQSPSPPNEITWIQLEYGELNLSTLKRVPISNCSAEGFPPWISIDQDSCIIYGTAPELPKGTTAKAFPLFDVNSTNGTLRIMPIVLRENPILIPIDTGYCAKGEECAVKVAEATGGTPPYSFYQDSFSAGTTPLGTSINSKGYLEGKPSQAGQYSFGICVTDSDRGTSCKTTGVIVQKKESDSEGNLPPARQTRNFTLSVSVSGEGKGAILADSGKILCGESYFGKEVSCEASYPEGSSIELYTKPLAKENSQFSGWSGDCSGKGGCRIPVDSDRSVRADFSTGVSGTVEEASCKFSYKASFNRYVEYVFVLSGKGTVTGPPGTEAVLIGAQGQKAQVPSWTGIPQRGGSAGRRAYSSDPPTSQWSASGLVAIRDEDGKEPSSIDSFFVGLQAYGESDREGYPSAIVLKDAKCARPDETANLTKLFVSREGNGIVESFPEGISCGTDCAYAFLTGENVTLYAKPFPGETFLGWSEACAGQDSMCAPLLDSERVNVSAEFSETGSSPSNSGGAFTIDEVKCTPAGLGQAYYNGGQEYLFTLEASGTVTGPPGTRLEISRGLEFSTHGSMYSGKAQTSSSSWKGVSDRRFDSAMRLPTDPESGQWSYRETGFTIVSGGGVNWPGPSDISINAKVWTPDSSGYLSVDTSGSKPFSCSPG